MPDSTRPKLVGKRARPRRPGRPPATAAGPDQRVRLLDAALACFVREGIAASTLRGIAAEAGVTPALAHYYFGSKQRLVDTVIAERLLPTAQNMATRLQAAGDDVGALVAGFVHGFHAVVAEHPWWPALWVREILNDDGQLRAILMPRITALGLPRLLTQRFAAAQARGELNPDLDPRLLVVSLIGLTMFPLAAAPTWRLLFAATDIDNQALARHTFALLDRGLALPASSNEGSS